MAVILLSLLVASVALPRLLKGLEVPPEPAEQREEDMARRQAAQAAIAAIEKVQHALAEQGGSELELHAAAAVRAMEVYRRRVEGSSVGIEAERLRQADAAERRLRLAGLRAEREEIFRLARHRRISDETSRRLVRELDLMEARIVESDPKAPKPKSS